MRLDQLRYERIVRGLPRLYARAADLGCGSGVLASLLVPRAGIVLALDLTIVRIRQVRTHVPTAVPLQADARFIPLQTGSLDLVVASEIIEHLPDYRPVLDEMSRVLAPGGTCVVSVPYREEREEQVCPNCRHRFPIHGHFHSFDEASLARAMRAAGLLPRRAITLNNAVATRLARLLNAPYPLLRLLDKACRRLLPHMNRHLIVFAVRAPAGGAETAA